MKKHLLSALFCLFVLTLQASERLNFRTFDVKSGIADNYVQSILCDRYGFMWFSTLNGLSRYDGYQFKTYTTTTLTSWTAPTSPVALTVLVMFPIVTGSVR